jgi:Pyridoxal phosphate biosynthesis protein
MARAPLPPLAVSLGDPAGIGPEVIAKCWDNRSTFALPPFVAIGDPRSIASVWDGPIELVEGPRQADAAFDYGLPVIQLNAPHADTRAIQASPEHIPRSIHWKSLSVSPVRGRRPAW